MKLKELLLNGASFNAILKQFSLEKADITIKDEELLMSKSQNKFLNKDILKEKVCIEVKNGKKVINLFGTIHCNWTDQRAVFEPDYIDNKTDTTLIN